MSCGWLLRKKSKVYFLLGGGMFKFELGEIVKVKVLNVLTTGEIVERTLTENTHGKRIRYGIMWDGKFENRIEPYEDDLVEYQQL